MEYSGVISEKEARAKILSAVAPLPATEVSLGDALAGRIQEICKTWLK